VGDEADRLVVGSELETRTLRGGEPVVDVALRACELLLEEIWIAERDRGARRERDKPEQHEDERHACEPWPATAEGVGDGMTHGALRPVTVTSFGRRASIGPSCAGSTSTTRSSPPGIGTIARIR